MPHIHTKPGQHDLTASAFIIRLDQSEPMIILHAHKRLNKLFHFGGHVELDENPWQALVREIKEESGYEIPQLKLLQPNSRLKKIKNAKLMPYPLAAISVGYEGRQDTSHFHDDLCYVFVTDQPPASSLSNNESHSLQLFTRAALADLSDSQVGGAIREMGLFAFDECLKNWDQVSVDDFASAF